MSAPATVSVPADAHALREAAGAALDRMLSRRPRVHAMLSPVAQPLAANIAAALGIDVSMSHDPVDAPQMVARSHSALINLGMLDPVRREGAAKAVLTGTPFVLDPVKIDRASERFAFAQKLIQAGPSVIKGNRAEMAALGAIADDFVTVTTGAQDLVRDGRRCATLHNGTPMLDRVIATGCAAGLLVAAMVAVETDPFVAATAGAGLMAFAGELAADGSHGPGSFAVSLIDHLAALDGAALTKGLRID
ncbi:hydroxyethylthiazole kinase [Acuticoccus sp. MNP-M23]|uniref:hydroxyethylthiazole kinase n=1 Tax=Acuticoccus sp. MNP-M23 TaxID=3072793 RepID=UPI002814A9D5|nr:hydroxyethylthiazole kinase [Acuticoccus sp. MNP-M23]WMS42063.1 hydroxyethylthiazole kinase [Acuticoccus sp. MNP-M23]